MVAMALACLAMSVVQDSMYLCLCIVVCYAVLCLNIKNEKLQK